MILSHASDRVCVSGVWSSAQLGAPPAASNGEPDLLETGAALLLLETVYGTKQKHGRVFGGLTTMYRDFLIIMYMAFLFMAM